MVKAEAVRWIVDCHLPKRLITGVMVLPPESGDDVHPFWYAQILGVFHAWVLHADPNTMNKSVQNFEFLWVCWFGLVPNHQSGFKYAGLPKVPTQILP